MGWIVCIGGGEISENETTEIDKHILALTGRDRNNVLFLPAASGDSEDYSAAFERYYRGLGAETSSLFLLDKNVRDDDILVAFGKADIIYIGGGNTIKLMEILRAHKLDDIFLQLFKSTDKVLCGLSAGCLCWFGIGMSNSLPGKWTFVPCLDIASSLACVGFSRDDNRQSIFKHELIKQHNDGFGLDDCAALVISAKQFAYVISADKNARVTYFHNENGRLREVRLAEGEKFSFVTR